QDAWLDDCTISGPADLVRERFSTWWAAGVMPWSSACAASCSTAVRRVADATSEIAGRCVFECVVMVWLVTTSRSPPYC
ncbi:MAG: hypothetical protein EBU98_06085, partial [Actinobacteria bacterium]|nr:hypothetical protein [Actinomycetota bacterium]